MKDNWNVALVGERVTLVPYQRHHVEKYHKWMSDPVLLEATASEPLSLEEEYKMQQEWHENPKNCTFILLDNATGLQGGETEEVERMVGDVNMFMHDPDDATNAELEIMIAEKDARGKGIGKEAVQLMMHYGLTCSCLGITRFFVKIHETNLVSLKLFELLGFVEVNYVPAFQEHELAFVVADNCNREKITQWCGSNTRQYAYPLLPPLPVLPPPPPSTELGATLKKRFSVLARVRPLSEQETSRIAACKSCLSARASSYGETPEAESVKVAPEFDGIVFEGETFDFDKVLSSDDAAAVEFLDSVLQSDDKLRSEQTTIISFGQTSSGKTHTATIFMERLSSKVGLPEYHSCGLRFFELRGDHCWDLLAVEGVDVCMKKVPIREDGDGRVVVAATRVALDSEAHALAVLRDCMARRLTRGTERNDLSSRSHAFCLFDWVDRGAAVAGGEQLEASASASASVSAVTRRTVTIVDLAGSERWHDALTHDEERLAEMKAINYSLGNIKHCLALLRRESKSVNAHVPYRNSKLTTVLKADLSPSSPSTTLLIVHLSPVLSDKNSTRNSLQLARDVGSGSLGRLERERVAVAGGCVGWDADTVSKWVAELGQGKFAHLVQHFCLSGRLLSTEWIGHCERRVVSGGGTVAEAHEIYEAFHKLVESDKIKAKGKSKSGDVGTLTASRIPKEQLRAFANQFKQNSDSVVVEAAALSSKDETFN